MFGRISNFGIFSAVCCCISLFNSISVECEVGFRSSNGFIANQSEILKDWEWLSSEHGCFVGKARNLVVKPGGSNENSAEILDITDGQRLCKWLTDVSDKHYSLKSAWENAQTAKRSQLSRLNFLRRTKEYFRPFPPASIYVNADYVDFFNKDVFGNPLPWATATFNYIPPNDEASKVAFAGMEEVFFGGSNYESAERVTVLLSPSPTYNEAVDLKPKTSVANTLLNSTIKPKGNKEPRTGWLSALSIYEKRNSKYKFTVDRGDFWFNGHSCYLTSIFEVEITYFSPSVCLELQHRFTHNIWEHSEVFTSVNIYISRVDLFNYDRPTVVALVDNTLLGREISNPYLQLSLDTDPQNILDFEENKSTLKKLTAAGTVSSEASTQEK